MPGKELFPNQKDPRGAFRHGTNRQVELTLRHELDDVAKKSVTEIIYNKQQKSKEPLDEEEYTSKRLQPEFVPKKVKEKRKTQPVFHDDIPAKGAKKDPKFQLVPNIPAYNPLDKGSNAQAPGDKTRKYPYTKDSTVTTKELKQPHISSVGVTPARQSVDVPALKVVLQGQAAAVDKDSMLDQMAMANKLRSGSPVSPEPIGDETVREEPLIMSDRDWYKKPAIVSSEGTTRGVQFKERQKPVPHPSSLKKPLKKRLQTPAHSATSIRSSLQSENISLPDDGIYSQYDDVIAGLDQDMENVQTAMQAQDEGDDRAVSRDAKSSKDLLEEARRISRPGSEALYKSGKKKESPRKRDGKKDSKKSAKEKAKGKSKEKEEETEVKPRVERTVDEIIASLRAHSGQKKISEADRRIQELLEGVMAGDNLYEDEEAQKTDSPDLKKSGSKEGGQQEQIPEEKEDGKTEGEAGSGPANKGTTVDQQADDKPQTDIQIPYPPTDTTTRGVIFGEEITDEGRQLESVDIKQIYDDLMAPPDATYEDIVSVAGQSFDLAGRQLRQPNIPQTTIQSSSVSFLSSWKPMSPRKYPPPEQEEAPHPSKNIHHFCTVTADYQLPDEFRNVGRKYHTPSRFEGQLKHPYRFGSSGPSQAETIEEETASQLSKASDERDAEEERLVSAARRVLMEADDDMTTSREDSFMIWKKRAENVFEQDEITVEGSQIVLKSDESRLYWMPAPPKLDVPPVKVKEVLFPEYQPAVVLGQDIRERSSTQQEEYEESEEEEEEDDVTEAGQEVQESFRVIYHKSLSAEDLTKLDKAKSQYQEDVKAGKIYPYEKRKLLKGEAPVDDGKPEELSRESTPIGPPPPQGGIVEPTEEEYEPVFPLLRRSRSDPMLVGLDDDTLLVPQDYNSAMQEIKRQKRNIRQMKLKWRLEEIERLDKEKRLMDEEMKEESPDNVTITALKQKDDSTIDEANQSNVVDDHDTLVSDHGQKLTSDEKPKLSMDEPTPAELALAAGRAYVILPKKGKKKKKRAPINMARLDDIERFLRAPPKRLERSNSLTDITKPVERELRVPSKVRSRIRSSIPDLLNFDEYGKKKGLRADDDEREWVRVIWNRWFDELYPPTPSDSEEEDNMSVSEDQPKEEKMDRKRKDSLTSSLSDIISVIDPIEETEENLELLEIMYEEVEKLDKEIAETKRPIAFDHCRRGALLRKLGMVKRAEEDLDSAIRLEPMLLDAYWHRHLLFLLQDKKKEALEDLTFILKHSKNHSGSYRSMAEIYRKQGEITMAVINYTQAVKLNPLDHEAYYQRALMYEKRGDMLLALEDLSKAKKIMPTRTDAILKHGLYYFEIGNWTNAIQDFTDLLKVDPLDASARTYRGRAYAKMQQWSPAVQDLSAAIHLDPLSWQAFFHRACILRKAHPKRALHDYSVSLLINDTDENVMSYLHRAILYDSMGKHEDAIPDFESVLKLNKDIACAHVNLGLIFMNHYDNYHRAIKKFASGIKVDPTYVRAYVCRGEAYHKIHELKLALRDFTRAIHLRPDIHHYYMYRGQLVLEMGNLDLAAFCVRHASDIGTQDSALGQMPTQQAVVQTFLKNYGKAIEALNIATRSKPIASLFMLLGKTQMKAKLYKDAIVSFERALGIYNVNTKKPWKPREPWPAEAGDAHFLIGMCHMELKRYLDSLEAFSNAIKLDSSYAEALYQRGVARTKLGMSKGIQDFNKALAINPKIFQAYLSRACYYGHRKNYTKAILNCNEAIKLQPHSVRAFLYRGALKYHIKAFDLAIQDLTKATSIDSSCALGYFNRAVCFQEKKDYQRALTDYGIVLLLGDDLRLQVLINRGLLYFERMDYTNALYDFKMAAKLKPSDQRILHTLGLCYHKMNQLKGALAVFTSCIEKNPAFLDGIIARGNVYMDCGGDGLRCARRDYERALLRDPLCLPARVNLAYTLQVSAKFMQAWTQFTTAIAIRPTFKPALEGRAIINLQMSNTFAAFQDINASIRVGPTAELYTNRGVVNQFMKDHVNAMRDYQAAIQMDPTYALAYFNAANVYFHTRHFRQAHDYYTKAILNNPKDESAFLNRAITKVMLRNSEGALSDFGEALKLSPHTAHMYFNRGNLYSSLGQYDKAEEDYSKSLSLKPDDALVLKRRADVLGKLGRKGEAIEDYRLAVEIQSRRKS
ncbi:uncharacterized protein LOC117329299 isoform X6 [Pecten maximus]|uniref:uncharacterized protein LOC117329299 isoform X6 n=1 Tax=Pecten maximus TaxID=6579 RepID=UPI0014586108|nr:uncharacterized protein LOC117329299 isoform X6 [Pecten maximus]